MAIVRLRPEELKRALDEGALSLQFQPQVHVPSGKLVGVEAFARWPHPAHGMIGPSDIVPLLDQGSLHVEFDRNDVDFLDDERLETERIHDFENAGETACRFTTFELLH